MAGIKRSRLYCTALDAVGFYYTARRTSWSTMMAVLTSSQETRRIFKRNRKQEAFLYPTYVHAHVCVFTLRWSPWWTRLIELSSNLLQVAVDVTCLSFRGEHSATSYDIAISNKSDGDNQEKWPTADEFDYIIRELNIKSRQESVPTRSLCNHTICVLWHIRVRKQTRSAVETAQERERERRGNYSILDLAPGST